MFRVRNTILSEEIATTRFACDIRRCKGACCVVGESGAPVSRDEIPALKKAFEVLEEELRPDAVETVRRQGLIQGEAEEGFELSCVDGRECVFVTYTENGEALCSIQKAYMEGRLNWEKPMSCHLYPIRLKSIGNLEYAKFEYYPELCGAGCANGEEKGIWLSEFLQPALERRYGREWVEEFKAECKARREGVYET